MQRIQNKNEEKQEQNLQNSTDRAYLSWQNTSTIIILPNESEKADCLKCILHVTRLI